MVIGQICHGSMGGSSRMACRIANALSKRGHDVHLFSREPVPWPVDTRVHRHVSGHSTACQAPLYWDWTDLDRSAFTDLLSAGMQARQFDVLHYHYARPFAGIVGPITGGVRSPLVVGTLHGTDLSGCLDHPRSLAMLSRELADTDILTTVSQDMYRRCAALPGALARPQVLPNFIEDDRFAFARSPSRRPTIMHVSNFRAVKDVGLLARLFLAVHHRTGARLCLVGDGPQLPDLRKALDASAAGSQVRYIGATARPEDHFSDGSVLLSTSVQESFGLVLLEAMAAGLPVIARAVGGVPELVEHGVSGMLFNGNQFASTVDRIVALLGSEETLSELRRGGLARAQALRESRVIGAYEALYLQGLTAREWHGATRSA
jgi:L-malate glycosyltransferase